MAQRRGYVVFGRTRNERNRKCSTNKLCARTGHLLFRRLLVLFLFFLNLYLTLFRHLSALFPVSLLLFCLGCFYFSPNEKGQSMHLRGPPSLPPSLTRSLCPSYCQSVSEQNSFCLQWWYVMMTRASVPVCVCEFKSGL